MRNWISSVIYSVVLIGTSSSALAVSTAKMIQEVESLYTAVPANDPARPQLGLRLADTLFDAAVEIGANTKATKEDFARQDAYRKKSIQVYTSVLNGFGGTFAAPGGELKAKIKFQLGRLYTDDGQAKQADLQWQDLVGQTDSLVIQREAALRLAEKLELSNEARELEKAKAHYDLALKNSDTADLKSYVLYRRAWANYRLKNSESAIADLQASLQEARGTAVDEILRDVILFLSNSKRDPAAVVTLVEQYSAQYKKPELVENLSDAYFVADNSAAYVYMLEYQNKKQVDSLRLVRLMDSYYAARKWDLFHARMMDLKANEQASAPMAADASTENQSGAKAKISSAAEVEKVFHRLIIQLDGERTTKAERAPLFKEAAELFVQLFPRSKETAKVMDGWLAAEESADKKLAQLQTWIELENSLANKNEEIRLRKIRAAVAVKAKNYAIVADESAKLNSVNSNYAEKRETNYQFARAQYELKNFAQALPVFQQLAMPTAAAPDQWAVLSQNLTLDILASQKKYDDLIAQAKLWTTNAVILSAAKSDKKLAQELNDMDQTAEKTNFEKFASLGLSRESLAAFKNYCLKSQFLPKSCENAKVLAIQLKDQAALLAILKAQNNNDALVDELEFGGYFAEAADLLSKKLNSKSAFNDWLKVALLYEIAGKGTEKEKTLKSLLATVKSSKTHLPGESQELLYLTLKEANLMSTDLLSIAWAENIRWRLLNDLQASGKGTADTKKQLMATCAYAGDEWNRLQIEKIKQLDAEQAGIVFVGKNSQKMFNKRVYALKTLSEAANCYMTGVGPAPRAVTLISLANSYREFSNQILNTPLPADLDEATANAAKEQLTEMAKPFGDQAAKFQNEATQQLAAITDSAEKVIAEDRLQSAKSWNFEGLLKPTASTTVAAKAGESDSILQGLLMGLRTNPYDNANVGKIQEHLQSTGQTRLAGYFKGRAALGKKEQQ